MLWKQKSPTFPNHLVQEGKLESPNYVILNLRAGSLHPRKRRDFEFQRLFEYVRSVVPGIRSSFVVSMQDAEGNESKITAFSIQPLIICIISPMLYIRELECREFKCLAQFCKSDFFFKWSNEAWGICLLLGYDAIFHPVLILNIQASEIVEVLFIDWSTDFVLIFLPVLISNWPLRISIHIGGR